MPEHPALKTSLDVPADPFFSSPMGAALEEVRWVKFIVPANAPDKIYFQNSQAYQFHYEFARDRIPAFAGMTRAEFDAVSLENEGRQAILGAILVPADTTFHAEYAVQLVSNDDLHPELVETVMSTVAAHVTTPAGMSPYYFPSGIAAECLSGKLDDLTARGVRSGSVNRWLSGDACYAPGWAIGKLVQLPAAEVDAAYLDGRLTPNDILLLTDAAPAELPYVAGVLTLTPSTPNAHTAILARSYEIPFAYLRQPNVAARAQALAGRRVVLSTGGVGGRDPFDSNIVFGGCDIRFVDAEALSAEDYAELLELRAPLPIAVTPKQTSDALTLPVADLAPADISRVGGKAAHFGLLYDAAPATTPTPAFALTFDAWDAFMAQPAPDGAEGSLRDEIARRLAPHTWPADLRALYTELDGIRDLIRDAPLPASLAESVREALADFDPERRIRFRSSTNVEDSESFTGAGLYDSATGCLADDLDGDALGPSSCNPNEVEERGVYRAIQRVYSSFYFDNAYLERLRRGVNEAEVGMGVLVHYSVPDPDEQANGVATMNVSEFSTSADLVTQLGAVSVTNPEGGALPETVHVDRYGPETYLRTTQFSSLLPLGANVLSWEADYRSLMGTFNNVATAYGALTGKTTFALDFEYKKVAPGELSVRQVRPLPLSDETRASTPFLVTEPEKLCIYGSEFSDGFAQHRLKTRISLEGRNSWLDEARLAQSIYTQARVEYVNGAAVGLLEGDPNTFPGASYSVSIDAEQPVTVDGWQAAGGSWALRSRGPAPVRRIDSPVHTLDDFFFEMAVTWDEPVPFLEFPLEGSGLVPSTRTEDFAHLWGFCPEDVTVSSAFPYIKSDFTGPNGLAVESSYWYPPPPRGVSAGYTAPAIKWERTTITGLVSAPIVLTGYFSQTYGPNHHNFGGQFIFEPRLEPGLSEAVRDELIAANIAALVIVDNDGLEDEFWVLGVDGELRKL